METVANFAFRNVKTLETVEFQEGLKTLGTSAFNGCTSLKEIKLPNSWKQWGAFAFANAVIETLTFGDNLQSVASWAFSFMGSLKHLVFTKGNDTSIEWIPSMDALGDPLFGRWREDFGTERFLRQYDPQACCPGYGIDRRGRICLQ